MDWEMYLRSFLMQQDNPAIRKMCAKQFVRYWGDACGLPAPRYGWCRDSTGSYLLRKARQPRQRRATP